MIAPYLETATINTTGDTVTVLRRQTIGHDEAIMTALENSGCFVIGTPQGFRYRRPHKRKFTRPDPHAVFIVKDDEITATLPGPYFYAHYKVVSK